VVFIFTEARPRPPKRENCRVVGVGVGFEGEALVSSASFVGSDGVWENERDDDGITLRSSVANLLGSRNRLRVGKNNRKVDIVLTARTLFYSRNP
jgi:hypothetical protein